MVSGVLQGRILSPPSGRGKFCNPFSNQLSSSPLLPPRFPSSFPPLPAPITHPQSIHMFSSLITEPSSFPNLHFPFSRNSEVPISLSIPFLFFLLLFVSSLHSFLTTYPPDYAIFTYLLLVILFFLTSFPFLSRRILSSLNRSLSSLVSSSHGLLPITRGSILPRGLMIAVQRLSIRNGGNSVSYQA